MRRRTRAFIVAAIALGAGVAAAQVEIQGPETLSQEHAILLLGAVTMNDSSPPPAPVLIKRICRSVVEGQAWTDSQGRYSFKVDGNGTTAVSGDASQTTGRSADLNRPLGNATQYSNPVTSSLRDCEITATLAGYRSAAVSLHVRSTTDGTRIPTIVLQPTSRADALSVSATTAMAPKSAAKAYGKGLAAMKSQDWGGAERTLTGAVTDYPKFAAAWFELGLVRERQGDMAGAVHAWQRAVDADGKYLYPYEKLATYADRKGEWNDAAKYSSAWIQLDPEDFPAAYLVNAIANAHLQRMDEAERSARTGLLVDKQRRMPRLSYVLGLILTGRHQYADAKEQFRDYLRYAPDAKDAGIVRELIRMMDEAASAVKR